MATDAVAEVLEMEADGRRTSRGTAFAVTPQHALTAFHVVGDRTTGAVTPNKIVLRFLIVRANLTGEFLERVAYFRDGDHEIDTAVLAFKEPLPSDLQPIPLSSDPAAFEPFLGKGHPRLEGPDISTIHGQVIEPQTSIFNGVPAMQVFCAEAGAQMPLAGMSGAPVLIVRDGKLAATGLIRWNPTRPEDPEALAVGGTVYACPITAIVNKWPEFKVNTISRSTVTNVDYGETEARFRQVHKFDALERRSLTSFVGREGEVAMLRAKLSDKRLITLTGSAGSGKTRLALETILTARERFPQGVYFIALDGIDRHTLVVEEIAKGLGIRKPPILDGRLQDLAPLAGDSEESRQLLDAVRTALKDSSVLLVLDNFEHVLGAAPCIAQLLETCSGLKILVTSREALRIQGEYQFAIEPLSVPGADSSLTIDELSEFPAVELFVQRACGANPKFVLRSEDVATIIAICRRLDGLPLAIELTAVNLRTHSLQWVLASLDHHMNLPTPGPRDLPKRLQSLQAAINWSYELLQPVEQRIFRGISVFTSDFSVDAAEAICQAESDPVIDIETELFKLSEKNLLQAMGTDRTSRFRMFEVIRDYGLERLELSGDAPQVRMRFENFFIRGTQQAVQPFPGATETTAGSFRIWLNIEIGNLRAVLDETIKRKDARSGIPLAVLMRPFWFEFGHITEGRQYLTKLLRVQKSIEGEKRRDQRLPSPTVVNRSQDWLRGAGLIEAAVDDWTVLTDPHDLWVADALQLSAILAVIQNDREDAKAHLKELRIVNGRSGREFSNPLLEAELSDDNGANDTWSALQDRLERHLLSHDERGTGRDLLDLGLLAKRRLELSKAKDYLEKSLGVLARIGDSNGIAVAAIEVAEINASEGHAEDASSHSAESIRAARESNDPRFLEIVLGKAGVISAQAGNAPGAKANFQEALSLGEKSGNLWIVSRNLLNLGQLALQSGEFEQAKLLLGRSEEIQKAAGIETFLADTLLLLDEVSLALGKLPERCGEAAAIFRRLANKRGEAGCLLVLAEGDLRMAQFDEALKRFQEAKQLFEEQNDSVGTANTIWRIAQVYMNRSDYAEAQRLYEQALELYKTKNAQSGIANCLRLLGDLHRKQNNVAEARTYYDEALKSYRALNNKNGIANVLMALGDLSADLRE